jgi:hypothetical protein
MQPKEDGARQGSWIRDQVRLERYRCLLKGLYIEKGLSLDLSTKSETVNEAKYSM